MTDLAEVSDLVAFGFDIPSGKETLAGRLLASVSEDVRGAAGSRIVKATSTVMLAGTQEQFLTLPAFPVRSVTSVEIDGQEVTDAKIRGRRLWRGGGWGGQHVDVEVTYTHGLDETPADIVRLVCQLAGAGLLADADGELVPNRVAAYERIDDYQIGYRTGDAEVVDVTELPPRVAAALRARFSGAAAVTDAF